MPPQLTQLVTVRSQLGEAVIDYLRKLEQKLDRTPWFLDGKLMAASGIAVPVRVLKESTRPVPPRPGSPRDETGERERRDTARDYVDPEIAALYEEASREKKPEEVPWAQERLQVHRAVVLGGPGSGKSFLTQTTAIELARAARDSLQTGRGSLDTLELPLHFTLARFADPALPPDPTGAVIELVRREFSPALCFLAWLKRRLTSPTTWLILDALDEVQGKDLQTLSTRLGAIATQGWQARVLLTCRPANWSRNLVPWTELVEYELAPFNPREIRQFMERWFTPDEARSTALVQALERNYSLAHAAHTPLIVTFLCLAHEEAPVSDKTRRVELYGRVVRGLVRRAWKATPLDEADPHTDDLVDLLVRVARPLFLLHPAGNLFTHAEVMRVLKDTADRPRARLDGRKETNAPDDLRDELIETGMLVNAGLRDGKETQFSFAHRSLLEYLVARSLNEEIQAKGWDSMAEFVDKKSWHPAWRETLLFLAGLMAPDDALVLLALLAEKSTDDASRQRLCLAGRCLPELSEAALQAYLQASQDKAAPLPQPRLPDIAAEILELWWKNESFDHVTNTLPALGAGCGPHLAPHVLQRLESDQLDDRRQAAEALGHLGIRVMTEPVVSRLAERQDDLSPNGAVETLRRFGAAAVTPVVLIRLSDWLRHPDPEVRREAAWTFRRLGPVAATSAVLSRLTEWLRDPEPYVRGSSVVSLWYLGVAAATEAVVKGLTDCLRDPCRGIRVRAAAVLVSLGPAVATQEVARQLANFLCSPDMNERMVAQIAWSDWVRAAATEEVVGLLTDCLRDSNPDMRTTAMNELSKLGAAAATGPVVDGLIACLRDPHQSVCLRAAHVLRQLAPAAATEEVVSRLTDSLRDPGWTVRESAAKALGPTAATEAVLRRLTECLRDHAPEVSAWVEALGELGAAAATEPVLSRLTGCLRHPVPDVRAKAAKALGGLGPAAAVETVLSRLTECLRDPDEGVRYFAVEALGRMGAAAATDLVLGGLTECLRDSDRDMDATAAKALGRLGPRAATEEVVSLLTGWLRDSRWGRWVWAAESLGELGSKAATQEVVSLLTDCLSRSIANRHSAPKIARALRKLGAAAAIEPAVSQRIRLLRHPNQRVRIDAAEVLALVGPPAASDEVLTCLMDCLGDSNWGVNRYAEGALGQMGPKAATEPVLNRLTDFLRAPEGFLRSSAAEVLGRLGPTAATMPIISRLTECLRDPEKRVRLSAVKSMDSFAHAGIRWFAKPDGSLLVSTVAELSEERS